MTEMKGRVSMHLDAIFRGGRIWTGAVGRPAATDLGVVGGMIVAVDEELDGCTAGRLYDLGGARVVPGFHDAHHHLSHRGKSLLAVDVSPDAVRTVDDLYGALSARARTLAPGAWLRAAGFIEQHLEGRLTLEGVDAASEGHPLWMESASRHYAMANTAAFQRMGFPELRDVPDVDGGIVRRDDQDVPTGMLLERAMLLAHPVVRPLPRTDLVEAILAAGRLGVSEGLTSITEPGLSGTLTGDGPGDLAAYQLAREAGLALRATVMPEAAALHDLVGDDPMEPGFGLDLGQRTGFGDDRLRIGGVKVFSDGALSAHTAAVCFDYANAPGERGSLAEDVLPLRRKILTLAAAGWQVATHAIGDLAVQTVIDAYAEARERTPENQNRHRIEHCGMADDDQIKRIRELDLVPVPQGRFLSEMGDAYVEAVGAERSSLLYRQRSFLDAGVEVPGSSDCPVVHGAPLLGIHALVNRILPTGEVHSPAERLTVAQAVRAFTFGSAYADQQEHRKGSLQRGRLADFVVLSDDIFSVDPERIDELTVVATIIGGEVVHGAADL